MHARRLLSSLRPAALSVGGSLALLLGASLPARAESSPQAALAQVLRASFEQPGRPMQLDPVLPAGRWGLVGWRQDGRGGRALLRRDPAGWTLVACAGRALRDPAVLQAAGMDAAEARALARRMTTAERSLSPRLSAELDRFPTLVQGAALAAHHGGGTAGAHAPGGASAGPHGGYGEHGAPPPHGPHGSQATPEPHAPHGTPSPAHPLPRSPQAPAPTAPAP